MNSLQIRLRLLAPTLLILMSSCGGGGGGGGGPLLPVADPIQSSFLVDVPFGTPADGLSAVQLDVVVADANGTPIEGVELEFVVSGFSNQIIQPSLTDVNGRASGVLRTTVGELKTVQAVVRAGARLGPLFQLTSEFVRLLPDTYFVRQGGSDGNSGTEPLEAWASLGFAFDQLQAGDTLHVGAGTYSSARMLSSGTQERPILILGDTTGCQTGDAGSVVVDAAGTAYGLLLDGVSHLTLRAFTVHGAEPANSFGGGIWIGDAGSQDLSVIDCELFENTRGFEVERAARLVIEGCSISSNEEDGIRLGLTSATSILNNLIYNNGLSGVHLVRLTGGLTVGLNTFHANVGPHLAETLPQGSTGSSALVTGNLFVDGGAASVAISPVSEALFVGDVNLAFGNLGIPSNLPLIGESIESDPMLGDVDGVDNVLGGFGRADDEFHLKLQSVALDAGAIDANQLTLSSSGSAATKSSTSSMELDGQGQDGDRINLGFHSPVTLPPYASALPLDTRISYTIPDDAVLRTALRSQGGQQWDGVQESQLTNMGVKWLTHRLAPTGPEELLATLVDTGVGTELYVRHWDGRRWSDNLELPVSRVIDSANVGERGFDLAYEQSSGDALFVSSNNDAVPSYRCLSQGVWSDSQPVFESVLGSGVVLWVELIPEVGSDRVAMIALDDAQSLTAAVWDGTRWEAPVLLGTQVVEMREFNSFAGAWESLSGDLMVMWGFSIFAEQARYAILDKTTGLWSGTQLYTNSEAVGSLIRMQSDPGSDRIAMAWGEGNIEDDVVVSTWDGDRFTNTRELSLAGQNGQHTMQVGWIGKTGKAFAIYRNRNTNNFERARFDRFWKFETPIQLPQMGRSVRAEIISDAGDDFAEVIILDANGSLFGFEVRFEGEGTVWTLTNGGQPLATGLSSDERTLCYSANRRASSGGLAPQSAGN